MALENHLDLETTIGANIKPHQIQSSHLIPQHHHLAHLYPGNEPRLPHHLLSSNSSFSTSSSELESLDRERDQAQGGEPGQDQRIRPTGIHSLEPRLLRYIFSFLAVQHYDYLNHRTHTLYNHLGPVSLVCKSWNNIASPLLWQERTFHGWKAGEELNVFLQLTENADFSSTHEYGEFVKRIEIIDSHDVVDKQNGQFVINWITPDVVLALSEHCSKRLRDLTLVFATGRQVSTEEEEGLIPWGALAESCRRLFMLSLTNYICPILPPGPGHPFHMFAGHTNPLTELVLKRCKNIPAETFRLLARTCGKALTKLVLLDSDEHLGAAEMIAFARHCPNLRHLNVSWIETVSPKINDEAMLELTSNCLRLEYISLLDANEISDLSFQTLA
ncbi:hypothetical protein BGZ94_004522, partial [Podila epigama]